MRRVTALLKAAFVAAFFMPVAWAMDAPSYTLSLGDTYATHSGEGIWWQQPYPHTLPRHTLSVGARADFTTGYRLDFGVGYQWVGNFKSNALAKASDQAYAAGTPYPLSRWIGSEQVQAVYAVARHTRGKWWAEGGTALMVSKFSMSIPDWVNCTDRPACLTPGAPQPIRVGSGRQYQTAAVAAVGYQFNDHAGVALSVFPTRISGTYPGLTKGYSPNLSFTWRF